MVDFSNLGTLQISPTTTVEYRLSQITLEGKIPVLQVAPATEANKLYINAMLKKSSRAVRQIKAGRVNSDVLEETRAIDRELYAKCVIKSWTNVRDTDRKDVKFNKANCIDFLNALPSWLFDDLRNFCSQAANFHLVLSMLLITLPSS